MNLNGMADMIVVGSVRGDCGAIHSSFEEWQKCQICERIILSRLTLEQRIARLERLLENKPIA